MRDQYELALFTAWHAAAFYAAAHVGKLEPWERYRAKFAPKPSTTAPQQPWQARKEERQRQMQMLQRHLKQKKAPPRLKRG